MGAAAGAATAGVAVAAGAVVTGAAVGLGEVTAGALGAAGVSAAAGALSVLVLLGGVASTGGAGVSVVAGASVLLSNKLGFNKAAAARATTNNAAIFIMYPLPAEVESVTGSADWGLSDAATCWTGTDASCISAWAP